MNRLLSVEVLFGLITFIWLIFSNAALSWPILDVSPWRGFFFADLLPSLVAFGVGLRCSIDTFQAKHETCYLTRDVLSNLRLILPFLRRSVILFLLGLFCDGNNANRRISTVEGNVPLGGWDLRTLRISGWLQECSVLYLAGCVIEIYVLPLWTNRADMATLGAIDGRRGGRGSEFMFPARDLHSHSQMHSGTMYTDATLASTAGHQMCATRATTFALVPSARQRRGLPSSFLPDQSNTGRRSQYSQPGSMTDTGMSQSFQKVHLPETPTYSWIPSRTSLWDEQNRIMQMYSLSPDSNAWRRRLLDSFDLFKCHRRQWWVVLVIWLTQIVIIYTVHRKGNGNDCSKQSIVHDQLSVNCNAAYSVDQWLFGNAHLMNGTPPSFHRSRQCSSCWPGLCKPKDPSSVPEWCLDQGFEPFGLLHVMGQLFVCYMAVHCSHVIAEYGEWKVRSAHFFLVFVFGLTLTVTLANSSHDTLANPKLMTPSAVTFGCAASIPLFTLLHCLCDYNAELYGMLRTRKRLRKRIWLSRLNVSRKRSQRSQKMRLNSANEQRFIESSPIISEHPIECSKKLINKDPDPSTMKNETRGNAPKRSGETLSTSTVIVRTQMMLRDGPASPVTPLLHGSGVRSPRESSALMSAESRSGMSEIKSGTPFSSDPNSVGIPLPNPACMSPSPGIGGGNASANTQEFMTAERSSTETGNHSGGSGSASSSSASDSGDRSTDDANGSGSSLQSSSQNTSSVSDSDYDDHHSNDEEKRNRLDTDSCSLSVKTAGSLNAYSPGSTGSMRNKSSNEYEMNQLDCMDDYHLSDKSMTDHTMCSDIRECLSSIVFLRVMLAFHSLGRNALLVYVVNQSGLIRAALGSVYYRKYSVYSLVFPTGDLWGIHLDHDQLYLKHSDLWNGPILVWSVGYAFLWLFLCDRYSSDLLW